MNSATSTKAAQPLTASAGSFVGVVRWRYLFLLFIGVVHWRHLLLCFVNVVRWQNCLIVYRLCVYCFFFPLKYPAVFTVLRALLRVVHGE